MHRDQPDASAAQLRDQPAGSLAIIRHHRHNLYPRPVNSGCFGSRERQRVDGSPLAGARSYRKFQSSKDVGISQRHPPSLRARRKIARVIRRQAGARRFQDALPNRDRHTVHASAQHRRRSRGPSRRARVAQARIHRSDPARRARPRRRRRRRRRSSRSKKAINSLKQRGATKPQCGVRLTFRSKRCPAKISLGLQGHYAWAERCREEKNTPRF